MTEDEFKAFKSIMDEIRASPKSEGSEYIWHRDGSVTENKWVAETSAKPKKGLPDRR